MPNQETNTTLFDITKIYRKYSPHELLQKASEPITPIIIYELFKLLHAKTSPEGRTWMAVSSIPKFILPHLAPYFGIYSVRDPLVELKRRLPMVYRELVPHIENLSVIVREYYEQVPSDFYDGTYRFGLTEVHTKTWGVKHFLIYQRNVETLKWPQKL